jgi:hypothetical protein
MIKVLSPARSHDCAEGVSFWKDLQNRFVIARDMILIQKL